MYCPNCGNVNIDDAEFCQTCNTRLNNEEVKVEQSSTNQNMNNNQKPVNNVNYSDVPTFSPTHSIFLIVFSFLCCGGIIGAIFGVLSLIEGNKVKDYVATGNIEMARQAKKNSFKWIKATYITWAVMAALMIICFVFVFGITMMNTV